jgi:hypothetical protein
MVASMALEERPASMRASEAWQEVWGLRVFSYDYGDMI